MIVLDLRAINVSSSSFVFASLKRPIVDDKLNLTVGEARALLHCINNKGANRVWKGQKQGPYICNLPDHYHSYGIKENDVVTIKNSATGNEFSFPFTCDWRLVVLSIKGRITNIDYYVINYLTEALKPYFKEGVYLEDGKPVTTPAPTIVKTTSAKKVENEGRKLIRTGMLAIADYAEDDAQTIMAKMNAAYARPSTVTAASAAPSPILPSQASSKKDSKKADKPVATPQSVPPKKPSWYDRF